MANNRYLKTLFNFVGKFPTEYDSSDIKKFCTKFNKEYRDQFYSLNFDKYITNYLYTKTYTDTLANTQYMLKALWLTTLTNYEPRLTTKNVNNFKIYWVRVIKNILALDINSLNDAELAYFGIKLFMVLSRFVSTVNFIDKHADFDTTTFSGMGDIIEMETALDITETLLEKYAQEFKLVDKESASKLIREIINISIDQKL